MSNKVPSQAVAARFLPTTAHIFPKFVTKVATTIHHLALLRGGFTNSTMLDLKWSQKNDGKMDAEIPVMISMFTPYVFSRKSCKKCPSHFWYNKSTINFPQFVPAINFFGPEKEALLGPLRAAGNLMTGQEILLMS